MPGVLPMHSSWDSYLSEGFPVTTKVLLVVARFLFLFLNQQRLRFRFNAIISWAQVRKEALNIVRLVIKL